MSKNINNFNLVIAKIFFKIRFVNLEEKLVLAFRRRYREFLVKSSPSAKSYQALIEIIIYIYPDKKRFTQKTTRGLPIEKGSWLYWAQKGKFRGQIDYQQKRAIFSCLNKTFYLNRILRFVFAFSNIWRGGVFLHASSITKFGRGYVFFGEQGVGKSTIAKISEAAILSDDSAVIFPFRGKFLISAMPFDPKAKQTRNIISSLKFLLAVNKAESNRLKSLERNLAPLILAHVRPNLKFFQNCRIVITKQFENCFDLANLVPIKRLYFKKNASFWRLIDG